MIRCYSEKFADLGNSGGPALFFMHTGPTRRQWTAFGTVPVSAMTKHIRNLNEITVFILIGGYDFFYLSVVCFLIVRP